MLISKGKGLTIHIVKKFKLAIFTWSGFTLPEVFKAGTIEALETLRMHPDVTRIILNTKHHHLVDRNAITSSVNSTVDYLMVAKGNYKMAVVPPDDILAKGSIDQYIDSLNGTLKKRFIVTKHETMKRAFSSLVMPKICFFLSGKPPTNKLRSNVFL